MLGLGCFAKITEDTLNRFFGRVQFLFNFATEKFVVIKDWRLVTCVYRRPLLTVYSQGLILRVLQVSILIYVLVDVVRGASYMLQEVLVVGWLCCLLTVEAIGAEGGRQSGGAIERQ